MSTVARPPELTQEELAEARRYSMLIQWSPEDEIYVVSVPELPGLHTHGATHEEAVAMGEDAIATWLAGLRWMGYPVPPPQIVSFGD
jgi:predicted RNase H-like HicB family nuclease